MLKRSLGSQFQGRFPKVPEVRDRVCEGFLEFITAWLEASSCYLRLRL